MKISAVINAMQYACFPILLVMPSAKNFAQNFQRAFGTALDNSFSKVIKNGSNYYVLGQNESSNGAPQFGTITRLDANGLHLWTLEPNIACVWNDAVRTPTGDLLVVGSTLPFGASSNSIIGLVTSAGGGNFTWLRTYNEPGTIRNQFTRIVKNPIPQNASYPYYILGSQSKAGFPTLDDVVLLNMNANGVFNWKLKYESSSDNKFYHDLEVLSTGDLLMAGNSGSDVIFKSDNSGIIVNGVQTNIPQLSYTDVTESSFNEIYAVGTTNTGQAHLAMFDNNLALLYDVTISPLTSISQVWESSASDLILTGRGTYGGISRGVIIDLNPITEIVFLSFYLNSGTSFTGESSWLMPNGQIAFTDSRVISGGFGQNDAFISVSDLMFNTCNVSGPNNPSLSLNFPLPDGPVLPPSLFQEIPSGTELTIFQSLDWQQMDVCGGPCIADFTYEVDCGVVNFIDQSTLPNLPTWSWTFSGGSPSTSTAQNPVITFSQCDSYKVCLTVIGGDPITSCTICKTVTIADTVPPVALCLGIGVTLDANCKSVITPQMIDGGSSDDCLLQSMSVSPNMVTGCGLFPVTLTVTDWCGNTSTCATTVETFENEPPVIGCPNNLTVTATTLTPCSIIMNNLQPTSVTDNCSTPTVSYTVTGATSASGQNNASGVNFHQGVSTVTYKATDACGNTATCSFTLTVKCSLHCDTTIIVLNSGWDNQTSSLIAPGQTDLDAAQDLDWLVTTDPINPAPPSRPANVVLAYPFAWVLPFSNSQWISGSPTRYHGQLPFTPTTTIFTFDINFNLPSVFSHVNLSMKLRADERIRKVLLNNNLIYQFSLPQVDGGFSGPPLILTSNNQSFFQSSQNNLSIEYSDESGDATGLNVAGTVTYDVCDTCVCGIFSDMAIRFERGPGTPLTCGASPVLLSCPPPGYSYSLTGKFECQGTTCAPNTPIDPKLTLPDGTVINYGTQSADPYFGIPISNLDLQQAGVYTVTFTGHCGTQECICVVKFLVDTPCIDVCPCNPGDIQTFSAAVNMGFAQVLSTKSCRACFSPIALGDCETVEWYLTNTGGTPIGTSTANNSFCYIFPGSGTYTVIMVVTRKKDDGSNCETFTKSQSVTITCLNPTDCVNSVFDNPGFSEGSVAGGLNSGGHTNGWKTKGNPKLNEGQIESFDGWTILLSGNLDTADVLSNQESICLEKGSGIIQLRLRKDVLETKNSNRAAKIKIELYRGDHFELGGCIDINCYPLAAVPLPDADSIEWFDIQIPYDLSHWDAFDTCGGIMVRSAVFVTNGLSTSQGGEETYSYYQLDNFCLNGTLVALEEPIQKQQVRIYPNPTSGELIVQFNGNIPKAGVVQIIDLFGRMMLSEKLFPDKASHSLSISSLPTGVYFVKVFDQGMPVWIQKVIKE